MAEMVLEKDGREVPCKKHPDRPAVDLVEDTPYCSECLKILSEIKKIRGE